jgi:hypothetical protein
MYHAPVGQEGSVHVAAVDSIHNCFETHHLSNGLVSFSPYMHTAGPLKVGDYRHGIGSHLHNGRRRLCSNIRGKHVLFSMPNLSARQSILDCLHIFSFIGLHNLGHVDHVLLPNVRALGQSEWVKEARRT